MIYRMVSFSVTLIDLKVRLLTRTRHYSTLNIWHLRNIQDRHTATKVIGLMWPTELCHR